MKPTNAPQPESSASIHSGGGVRVLQFFIPSLLGLLLFVIPMKWDGKITVPIACLARVIQDALAPWLPLSATILIGLAWLGAAYTRWFAPKQLLALPLWKSMFHISRPWFVTRTLGMIFALCTLFQWGPHWLRSENTGELLLTGLIPGLLVIFLLAGLLLPLLVDFGLLEFFGALMTKIMRPLFTLPGRSSITCIASWLGDGSIGVMITSKQYELGHYTKREAAVIGTTFTAVSIPFSLVVLSTVNLTDLFLPYYATVTFAGMVAAIIMPRIPPLSRKPDTYSPTAVYQPETDEVPPAWTTWRWALYQAVSRAQHQEGPKSFLRNGSKNILDLWVGVIPVVMAIGTIAVTIAEFTPLFKWLGWPFIPLLYLLNVPEAEAASQAIIVGFADMFLPSILAATISSELTRFVIAALSITQLIFLTEVGGLLLGSKIPINFKDLLLIFLLRTLITLPIIAMAAHLLF